MKLINFALVAFISAGTAHAQAQNNMDVRSGMFIDDFLTLSVVNQNDANKMAEGYYKDFLPKNPIDRYIKPKSMEAFSEAVKGITMSPWMGGLDKSSIDKVGEAKEKGVAIFNKAISDESVQNALAYDMKARPPFDDWAANYIFWLLAATQSGAKAMSAWPDGTNPVVGEISYGFSWDDRKYGNGVIEKGIHYLKSPDRPGANPLEGLGGYEKPSPILSDDRTRAHVFMRQSAYAGIVVSQWALMFLQGEHRNCKYNIGKLLLSNPLLTTDFDDCKTGIRPFEVDVPYENISSFTKTRLDKRFGQNVLLSLKALEETVNLWHFMPLSEKNSPPKFAFKIPGMLWVVATFTDKGLKFRTVPSAAEFNELPQLRAWHSRGEYPFTCWGGRKRCSDFYIGNFGDGLIMKSKVTVKLTDKEVDTPQEVSAN